VTLCEVESLLLKYNLTIILSVGLIVVVVRTKSSSASTGIIALTHPMSSILEVRVGPIGVPLELASCIST
jgi:hypothetical protein